jgi:hypothetical protein
MNIVLPGCFSFKQELSILFDYVKDELTSLLYHIYEIERVLNF